MFLRVQSVSVLLSHIVLSELYQEQLVTEDEVKRLKEGEHLADRLVSVQCPKTSDVATRTAVILDKFEHNEEARNLRGS